MFTARVHSINVSQGGVPKRPVPSAGVTRGGVEGDAQNDRRHHGGPDRAVCLFPLSLIERLRLEGHPITPGSTGENLTLDEVAPDVWASIVPGTRLEFTGGVELEVASFCAPCSTIRDSFLNLDSKRIKQELHPGESRLYARVIREGRLEQGESVTIRRPA